MYLFLLPTMVTHGHCETVLSLQMLLYLRMVTSRAPPPQFSASSTNRRTTHLAGRRRQPLTPETWASLAEPLAPRHSSTVCILVLSAFVGLGEI